MDKKIIKTKITHYLLIVAGTLLMAASVNWVYEPLELVTGGITGLAIVIKKLTSIWIDDGVPIWLTTIILNIPLFIAAILVKGRTFLRNTLFGTVSLTVALYIVPPINLVFEDMILASVMGGVLDGVGLGLIFVSMASTGGSDLLAMIIHKYKPYLSVPQILIVIDTVIVLAGIVSFGIMKALYAIIAVYILAKVSDGILEGLKFAKMAYIISDYYNEIAGQILIQLDRGVTGITATGMYSNAEKKMLFCVVSKKEIVKLTDIVAGIDPKAFIIVSDAREVTGEGFREYRQ
ncbi:MAG: hypothetical protein K0S61_3876 [Anaerocolumna sp.]|jgi:uncharacterized membrane-anchored protein YitT (DUF2179 family)|nr:hypothetical protein [Anaerocolumna sp.]